MNNMNKKLRIATIGLLLSTLLLIGSCGSSISSDLEGTYVGTGKLLLKKGSTTPEGSSSNMTVNISKESSDLFLHISDKETSADWILEVTPTIRDEFSLNNPRVRRKVCELVVDGVSYELKEYSLNGNGEQENGVIKIKISFYAQADRDNKPKFEFEFEGKRTK